MEHNENHDAIGVSRTSEVTVLEAGIAVFSPNRARIQAVIQRE